MIKLLRFSYMFWTLICKWSFPWLLLAIATKRKFYFPSEKLLMALICHFKFSHQIWLRCSYCCVWTIAIGGKTWYLWHSALKIGIKLQLQIDCIIMRTSKFEINDVFMPSSCLKMQFYFLQIFWALWGNWHNSREWNS